MVLLALDFPSLVSLLDEPDPERRQALRVRSTVANSHAAQVGNQRIIVSTWRYGLCLRCIVCDSPPIQNGGTPQSCMETEQQHKEALMHWCLQCTGVPVTVCCYSVFTPHCCECGCLYCRCCAAET